MLKILPLLATSLRRGTRGVPRYCCSILGIPCIFWNAVLAIARASQTFSHHHTKHRNWSEEFGSRILRVQNLCVEGFR